MCHICYFNGMQSPEVFPTIPWTLRALANPCPLETRRHRFFSVDPISGLGTHRVGLKRNERMKTWMGLHAATNRLMPYLSWATQQWHTLGITMRYKVAMPARSRIWNALVLSRKVVEPFTFQASLTFLIPSLCSCQLKQRLILLHSYRYLKGSFALHGLWKKLYKRRSRRTPLVDHLVSFCSFCGNHATYG